MAVEMERSPQVTPRHRALRLVNELLFPHVARIGAETATQMNKKVKPLMVIWTSFL
jgi:hypothetical protein